MGQGLVLMNVVVKTRSFGGFELEEKCYRATLNIGSRGERGINGINGGQSVIETAGETLSALIVVRSSTLGLVKASSDNTESARGVLGITITSANQGSDVQIQTGGELEDSNWNWIPGRKVFLGLNGALTQSRIAIGLTGSHVSMGVAMTRTRILVRIQTTAIVGG
jgi:hypothetical protein